MAELGVSSQVGRDQFMQLLVTQMRNQNPLDPIKDADFIAQLAQFSSLEGIEKLNSNFDQMLALQQFTGGSNLIGKTVQYQLANSQTPSQGTVSGITIQDGAVNLIVGGARVPLSAVNSMYAPAS